MLICLFHFLIFGVRLSIFLNQVYLNEEIKAHLVKGPDTPHCKQRGTLQRIDLWERAAKRKKENAHNIHQKHFMKHQALDSVGPFLNIVLLSEAGNIMSSHNMKKIET